MIPRGLPRLYGGSLLRAQGTVGSTSMTWIARSLKDLFHHHHHDSDNVEDEALDTATWTSHVASKALRRPTHVSHDSDDEGGDHHDGLHDSSRNHGSCAETCD